jgi:O-antigen ligase/cytochrome c-type biogenesis protein CcmH/NrfG
MPLMKTLEKTLYWIAVGGVFALPFVCLLVTTSLFFPYITGKNFAFRIIVEVMTGAWLALTLVYPQYRPRRAWILGAFAVFVLIIAVADAQGVNAAKSFWSNFERMDGFVTLIHLLAYLVVAASLMRSETIWRRLFQTSLVVSAFVSIFGLLQIAGTLAIGQGGGGGFGARVDATFGNPIYLAVYMLFHIFIAALLWMREWSEKAPGKRTLASVLYCAVIVLDTVALLFTGTRGTILGLIGGGVLAVLIFAFLQGSRRTRTTALISVCVVLVLGAGIYLGRDTGAVKGIVFLDRLASISTSDTTIAARFLNMGVAWQGVKERPFLGWGQENYAIVFDKYYDPRMYADEPWFDRVHNIIFDWLIAGGFLGLISYLAIFAAALWTLWQRASNFSTMEKSIFTGLFAGYFFHNLTVFDNVTSYILFATILAYIAWRAGEAAKSPGMLGSVRVPQSLLPICAAAAVALVWGAAWFVNASALSQNRALIGALSQQQGGVQQNLALYKQALSYGSYGTQEAREQLAQAATQVISAQSIDASVRQQFFQLAGEQMALQAQAAPLDARFPLFLGVLEGTAGDYANAAASFEKAHELSPRKQAILYQIAINAAARGEIQSALRTLKDAYELETDNTDALIYYATGAINAKQDALADQLLAPLIASGKAADNRILSAYASRNRFDKLQPIWEAHVKASPDDIQGYFTLAAIYYQNGNSAKAIQELQQAETLSPAVAQQAESLIDQIRKGTLTVTK